MARDKIIMECCVPGAVYVAFECDTSYRGKADENGRVVMTPENTELDSHLLNDKEQG